MNQAVVSLVSRATHEIGASGLSWEQLPNDARDAMGLADYVQISRGGLLVPGRSRTGDIVVPDTPEPTYEDNLVAILHKSHDLHLGAPWSEWASPSAGSYLLRLAKKETGSDWQGLWVPYDEHEGVKNQRLITYFLPKATELTPEQVQAGHDLIDLFRAQRGQRLAAEIAVARERLAD